MFDEISNAQIVFHKAINDLDVSINGKVDQFAEAFKAYGTGKDNVPNRFQRWFWRLRHTIVSIFLNIYCVYAGEKMSYFSCRKIILHKSCELKGTCEVKPRNIAP